MEAARFPTAAYALRRPKSREAVDSRPPLLERGSIPVEQVSAASGNPKTVMMIKWCKVCEWLYCGVETRVNFYPVKMGL
jgi:hypothetical protein